MGIFAPPPCSRKSADLVAPRRSAAVPQPCGTFPSRERSAGNSAGKRGLTAQPSPRASSGTLSMNLSTLSLPAHFLIWEIRNTQSERNFSDGKSGSMAMIPTLLPAGDLGLGEILWVHRTGPAGMCRPCSLQVGSPCFGSALPSGMGRCWILLNPPVTRVFSSWDDQHTH